jgi:hypothetical protein
VSKVLLHIPSDKVVLNDAYEKKPAPKPKQIQIEQQKKIKP